ncbi:hypothetical protein HY495_01155 [Candidatus Woesearchaeota archaeon]|nr:hypothetical protein [Candidatus Woesearchaeota archaeon]
MKNAFVRYLHSFSLNSTVIKTFGIDLLASALIVLCAFLLNKILEWRLVLITGGKDVESLKTALLSASTDTAQQFLFDTKVFVVLFFGVLLLILLFTLVCSAVSQYGVWSLLFKRKTAYNQKNILPWLKLFAAFLLLGLAVLLVYFLLITLLHFLLPGSAGLAAVIVSLFNALCLLLFLVWTLVIEYYFIEKENVWGSIGAAFRWIQQHYQKFSSIVFFGLLTFIIINLLYGKLLPVSFALTAAPPIILLIKLLIFLGFYNWLRWYVVREIA